MLLYANSGQNIAVTYCNHLDKCPPFLSQSLSSKKTDYHPDFSIITVITGATACFLALFIRWHDHCLICKARNDNEKLE